MKLWIYKMNEFTYDNKTFRIFKLLIITEHFVTKIQLD